MFYKTFHQVEGGRTGYSLTPRSGCAGGSFSAMEQTILCYEPSISVSYGNAKSYFSTVFSLFPPEKISRYS